MVISEAAMISTLINQAYNTIRIRFKPRLIKQLNTARSV